MVTEEVFVIYDERQPVLQTITMFNLDHSNVQQRTVFDFTKESTAVPNYLFSPQHPAFTFQVVFADNTAVSEVYVVTENYLGNRTYVETAYDETAGAWVGSWEYDAFTIPARVGATYSTETGPDDPRYGEAWIEDISVSLEEEYSSLTNTLAELFNENLEIEYDDESQEFRLWYTNEETGEQAQLADMTVELYWALI